MSEMFAVIVTFDIVVEPLPGVGDRNVIEIPDVTLLTMKFLCPELLVFPDWSIA